MTGPEHDAENGDYGDVIELDDETIKEENRGILSTGRENALYREDRGFDTPLLLAGTRRILRQSSALRIEDVPSPQHLEALITRTHEVDSHLRLRRMASLSSMRLHSVTPDVVTFRAEDEGYEGEDRLYYIDTPMARSSALAFQKLSKLLNIPFQFSKRNPSYLNKVIFEYWLRLSASQMKNPPLVDLVFEANSSEISVLSEGAAEPETVVAYRVVNVLTEARPKQQSAISLINNPPPAASRVPMLSSILGGVRDLVKDIDPNVEVNLQSYALGFDEKTNGNHFARVLFESPATKFDLDGEPFQLGLNIEADWTREGRHPNAVRFSPMLWRQICSNGMVAPVSAEDSGLLNRFLSDELAKSNFTLEDSRDDSGNQEAINLALQARTKFEALFSENGVQVSVPVANAGLDLTMLRMVLEFFFNSASLQRERMENLREKFAEVSEEEFVRTCTALQKTFKLQPEIVKIFLMQYVAGEVTGKQLFRDPMSVVNFLTFTCRAYDIAVQAEVERVAISYAAALAAELRKQKTEQSQAAHYRRQLDPDLLGRDAA